MPLILHHHERYAGHGYPFGLRGDEIPLGARIVAIADAYDAMTSDRPYKRAMSHEAAIRELRRHAGTQFDPALVRLFCELFSFSAPAPDPESVRLLAGTREPQAAATEPGAARNPRSAVTSERHADADRRVTDRPVAGRPYVSGPAAPTERGPGRPSTTRTHSAAAPAGPRPTARPVAGPRPASAGPRPPKAARPTPPAPTAADAPVAASVADDASPVAPGRRRSLNAPETAAG